MGIKDILQAQFAGKRAYKLHTSAMQLRNDGKYDKSEQKISDALVLYEKAFDGGDRSPEVLRGYALLLMRRGAFEKARAVMIENGRNKSLPIEDRLRLRINYSICLWKMGELDRAIEIIERAELIRKNGDVYNTKGILLIERAAATGDFAEAEALMSEAMEYDDEDAGTLDNLGQLKLAQSAFASDPETRDALRQEAFEAFERACRIKPRQTVSAYNYAKMLYERGERDKAREVLERVIDIPHNGMMQVSRESIQALWKGLSA